MSNNSLGPTSSAGIKYYILYHLISWSCLGLSYQIRLSILPKAIC